MRAERGFGLLELLLAMALGSLTCLAALSLLEAAARSMRSVDATSSAVESGEVAASVMASSLGSVRPGLCGGAASWRNHLSVQDPSWWATVRSGSRVYGASEAASGTAFGPSAARRVTGTHAVDVFRFERDSGELLQQDSPSSELRVSSIQGYAVGDVAVVCSPVSSDVFMVTGRALGRLHHASGSINAYGQSNCSSSFHEASFCAGSERCVAGGDGCSAAVAFQLGRVRGERWYIGWNSSGERSLYMAELENDGPGATPTAVRPVEIVPGVSSLMLSRFDGGVWSPVTGALGPGPLMVTLEVGEERKVRRVLRMGSS